MIWGLAVPIILLPYSLIMLFWCMYNNDLMETVFHSNAYVLLQILIVLIAVAVICTGILCTVLVSRKISAKRIAKLGMIIKVSQIPAFIAIFLLGAIYFFTIFTIAFSILFVLFDAILIFMTGSIGLMGVITSYREKKLRKEEAIVFGIGQYVYCFDIVSAIIVFVKARKENE